MQSKKNLTDIWSEKLSIPVLAIDIVIFTIYKQELCLVLLKDHDISKNNYLLPWWIVMVGYSLEDNFDKILENKTWITWVYKEQLYTFWDPKRDKRWHTVSVAYFALVWMDNFLHSVDFTKVEIIKYSELDNIKMWFDHKDIIKYAKQRLKWKLEYTNIAKDMLGETFRISQLQEVYQIVLWAKLDKRNFQKKIFKLKMIEETWEKDKSTNRPAKLYRFIDKELKVYEVI